MDLITITPEARIHLKRQLAKSNSSGLLLSIKPSGCNGYQYSLAPSNELNNENYLVMISPDSWLSVTALDLPLLQGLIIDYVTEGLNGKFAYHNPNSSGTCGCGKSFNV